jgi:hypothetical protein
MQALAQTVRAHNNKRHRRDALLPQYQINKQRADNPLIGLAADCLRIYEARIGKGLQPKGTELPTALAAMQTLTRIRKCQHDLTEVKHHLSHGGPNMSLEEMLKRVERLMKSGNNLDQAEALIDTLTKQIKHKVTVESSDGDGEDDWSEPADAKANGNNASLEDGEDGEDDEEDDSMGKASVNEFVRTHDSNNRPGKLKTSDHDTYRTKVQAMVDNISATENCSKPEALRRLRERHPDIVAGNPINKSAPMDFETAVEVEMRKGCSELVAQQRVMQMYGNLLPRTNITKGEVASAVLEDAADTIWKNDASLSRCESLRAARLANPSTFRRMQRV